METNILINEIENYRHARRLVQKLKLQLAADIRKYPVFKSIKYLDGFQTLRRAEFYLTSEIIRLKAKKNFRCEC